MFGSPQKIPEWGDDEEHPLLIPVLLFHLPSAPDHLPQDYAPPLRLKHYSGESSRQVFNYTEGKEGVGDNTWCSVVLHEWREEMPATARVPFGAGATTSFYETATDITDILAFIVQL